MTSIKSTSVLELEQTLGAAWPAIRAARTKTAALRAKLVAAVDSYEADDCAIMVTGSLGRGEANDNSDADWVLLTDGPSNPSHAQLGRRIDRAVADAGFKDVGPTGTFGDIVASHELVHYIAGTRDTNENLTRRMLLLAESHALTGAEVRKRVIRNVLSRYVTHDRAVRNKAGRFHRIPHFLLNDVVRYWRTIASDFASKMWERNRKGWATRNIKLRFSRKLLFAWGLIAAFSGELFPTEALETATDEDTFLGHLADLIRTQTEVTPLDLLAQVAMHEQVSDTTTARIFSAYDVFLGELSDPAKRKHLDDLPFETAADDALYDQLRQASIDFSAGIGALFFDEHPKLSKLIRRFGVF